MEIDRFHAMVARLEEESRSRPGVYRAKVVALAALGFGILALVLAVAGFGLVLLVGVAVAAVWKSGALLILLLKLGKLVVVLAVPLWLLVRSATRALFVRLPRPAGVAVTRAEAPALFEAIDTMRHGLHVPRFHDVLIVDEVNAAVVQRPAFGLFGWPRNYLVLGLPLLDAMAPAEALAVVAHEYGHLARAHGRFSAFIYRLRHSWLTMQACADQWQGWTSRPLQRLVGWYAPYFNAYTFVLARADEYEADAASAALVGPAAAARALKRVNLVAPRYQAFLGQTFERIADDPAPPGDLALRWARASAQPAPSADAQAWLNAALDRQADVLDTHPVLRRRLAALPGEAGQLQTLPPPLDGPSAAQAWLAPVLPALRSRFASAWAARVAEPWGERHTQLRQQRERLAALRAQPGHTPDEALELLDLQLRLEPRTDVREPLAAWNALHPDRAWGVFVEAAARLDRDDAAGLPLLERAIVLDADLTLASCSRALAFLDRHPNADATALWLARGQERQRLEQQRERQLHQLDEQHTLAPAALDGATLAAVLALLRQQNRGDVAAVFLVRRLLPADPTLPTYVLAVQLTLWGRLRRRHQAVRQQLAALEWPVHLFVLSFQRGMRSYEKRVTAVPGARLF